MIIEITGTATRVEFAGSAALETLFAVGLLVDPSHHCFAEAWVAEVEALLSPEEGSALTLIRKVPKLVAFTDLLLRSGPWISPEQLAELISREPLEAVVYDWCDESLPLEQVRAGLLDPDQGARTMLAQRPGWMGGSVAHAHMLFARIREIRDAYASLVRRVWEIGVRPRLPEIEPLWADCLAGLRVQAEETPPRELATRVFGRRFARRFGPGHAFETICFVPSYFASPHKAALFDATSCIIVADCRLGPYALQQMRDELAASWKAVTEPTRLEILRLCSRDAQYGQSLAASLKLKPATIAHHLEILRSHGLLEEETAGSVKYHRLRRDRLESLFLQLKQYLYQEL